MKVSDLVLILIKIHCVCFNTIAGGFKVEIERVELDGTMSMPNCRYEEKQKGCTNLTVRQEIVH